LCWVEPRLQVRRRIARRHFRPRVAPQFGAAYASRNPRRAPVSVCQALDSPSPRLVATRGRLRFRVGDVNPCSGVLYPCTGRTMGSQTLPVAPPLRGSRFRRAGLRRTEDPFHRRHTNAAVSQARSAFRRQIPLSPVPLLALRTLPEGRHWSLGFAAAVQLPTRIHPYRYELGPAQEPVIHRSERGHVPPIDFCSLWTPEHDHRCPNPTAFFSRRTSRRTMGDNAPKDAANQAVSA
jgi:hypothetical protein